MKCFVVVFLSLFLSFVAEAQKASNCSGEQTYKLVEEIVANTVPEANNLSSASIGEDFEQGHMVIGEGKEVIYEKWFVSVIYDANGVSGQEQSFEVIYTVSIDTDTLQAHCRFLSASQTDAL